MTNAWRRHDDDATTARRPSQARVHKPGFGAEPRFIMKCQYMSQGGVGCRTRAYDGRRSVVAPSWPRRYVVVMPSVYRRRAVSTSSPRRRHAVVVPSYSDIATPSSLGPNYRQKPPVVELLLPLENLVCMCSEFS